MTAAWDITTSTFYLWAHVVVFAVWFGTDLCTFSLSRRVIDSSIDVATRRQIATAMLAIEVLARLCLPVMLGIGVGLTIEMGFVDQPDGLGFAAIGVALVWASMVWVIHRQTHHGTGTELTGTLTKVDLALRSLVCAALWVTGLWSAFSDGGPWGARFIGVKVALFALIMTCGIIIRFTLRPFSAAFGDLLANGSSPEREAAMAGALRRSQRFVGVIWASLLLAGFFGVARQVPWG